MDQVSGDQVTVSVTVSIGDCANVSCARLSHLPKHCHRDTAAHGYKHSHWTLEWTPSHSTHYPTWKIWTWHTTGLHFPWYTTSPHDTATSSSHTLKKTLSFIYTLCHIFISSVYTDVSRATFKGYLLNRLPSYCFDYSVLGLYMFICVQNVDVRSDHLRHMRRRILVPDVNRHTWSCPFVIRSHKTYVYVRCGQSHFFFHLTGT